MAKINEADHPSIGSIEYGGVLFAVHRDGDANIWYCAQHEFVQELGRDQQVCVTCGQEPSHPVHDVRAYDTLLPKP
jgi:hypothetical protein